tara:strand:+ start:877 stop:1440 length:564 start_codon:yes stop_codon:yes gene_type:complete
MTPDEMMERRRQLLRDQTPMFSMPNIMNMFGGNQSVPQTMDIRPEVLDMMKRQQNAKPPPGMFFGFGPRFSTEAYNQANNIPTGQIIPPSNTQNEMQKAISSVYNLTGDNAGTIKDSVTEPGFMEKLGDLSSDEIMGGLQGIQGLLNIMSPEETPLPAPSIARASPGLSLSVNPYEDLYKRYGLLGR